MPKLFLALVLPCFMLPPWGPKKKTTNDADLFCLGANVLQGTAWPQLDLQIGLRQQRKPIKVIQTHSIPSADHAYLGGFARVFVCGSLACQRGRNFHLLQSMLKFPVLALKGIYHYCHYRPLSRGPISLGLYGIAVGYEKVTLNGFLWQAPPPGWQMPRKEAWSTARRVRNFKFMLLFSCQALSSIQVRLFYASAA